MLDSLRYLLLQVRDADDPMREHEVQRFARALRRPTKSISVLDLLNGCPRPSDLVDYDVVLLGGSGDYSVVEGGPWLEPALDAMRELHESSKPTFASCWGFQAMARATGGSVVHDPDRAEVGTFQIELTPEGERDPVLGALGPAFPAQVGHEDTVVELPPGAIRLASTERVANHAYCFAGKPIYCTQFHPELDRESLLDRLRTYPKYVERISGLPFDAFAQTLHESPMSERVLRRFVEHVFA